MIPATWFNSLSPGNEQKFYFGSEGRTVEGTRNYPGIADPAVDAAIEAMLNATSQEDFVAAVRAEDRLLVSGFYIVPLYRCGRTVGGALEPHRPARTSSRCPASRRRRSGAILDLSRAKRRRAPQPCALLPVGKARGEDRPDRRRLEDRALELRPLEDAVLRLAEGFGAGPGAGRAAVHPHGQFARFRAAVLRRQCSGRGADPGLAHADVRPRWRGFCCMSGARVHRMGRRPRPCRRLSACTILAPSDIARLKLRPRVPMPIRRRMTRPT